MAVLAYLFPFYVIKRLVYFFEFVCVCVSVYRHLLESSNSVANADDAVEKNQPLKFSMPEKVLLKLMRMRFFPLRVRVCV